MSVYIPEAMRAREVWRAIEGKGIPITFRDRRGTAVVTQILRIEYEPFTSQSETAAGSGTLRRVQLFGVINHPTAPDSLIEEGYRFIFANREYTVTDKIILPGEVQAVGIAVS
jgi:hypothetical protein